MLKLSMRALSSQAGFSLLEMTIALAILGILGTFTLPMINEYRHHRAIRMTRDHQERVVKSLECYLVQHGRLPRPGNFPNERAGDVENNLENVIGIVPYYALGLPEAMSKDGYGHLMTYVAANDACEFPTQESYYGFCKAYQAQNNNLIEIKDSTNTKVVTDPEKMLQNLKADGSVDEEDPFAYEKNYIVFALISHGPDGSDKAGSPEEEENNKARFNQNKITLLARPYSINTQKLFRHQIVWGTQREMAGFCKNQKIISALKKFEQTFGDLKDFTETMEKSSDIFDKLKRLIPQTPPLSEPTEPNSAPLNSETSQTRNHEDIHNNFTPENMDVYNSPSNT